MLKSFVLLLAVLAPCTATPIGRILDGYFHWDNTGAVSGSMIGTAGSGDSNKRGFAFIGIRNEDQTFCMLDMWSCNWGGDYFPKLTLYQERQRPDIFFNAGSWAMNFSHFDQSKWTKPRFTVFTPFQMFFTSSVLGGDPNNPNTLFTISQGLKGKAKLIITGRPGAYQIESADMDLVANPEPATMLLMGTGLVGLAWWKRRKRGKIEA